MRNQKYFALNDGRRDWLKQAGALSAFATKPFCATKCFSQTLLSALPRLALIIGNAKYADAPLKNPANDAKAIANELQKTGFRVHLHLDAARHQMADAINVFSTELAKTKGVGMFYYAGHGAQLAWRNYLIPIGAAIEHLEDMRTKTIELNSLLEGLTKANNAMNIIMIDACRDNPFGAKVTTEQKGLSQFDAPPRITTGLRHLSRKYCWRRRWRKWSLHRKFAARNPHA